MYLAQEAIAADITMCMVPIVILNERNQLLYIFGKELLQNWNWIKNDNIDNILDTWNCAIWFLYFFLWKFIKKNIFLTPKGFPIDE